MRGGIPAVLAVSLAACGGTTAPVERPRGVELGWSAPTDAEPAAAFPIDHPLRAVAEAVEAGDCPAVVSESEEVQRFLEREVARVLHSPPPVLARPRRQPAPDPSEGGLDGGAGVGDPVPDLDLLQSHRNRGAVEASSARALLDETVYRQPPVLEVGEHGFRLPRWWARSYGYCLAEEGRPDEAAEVFTLMLWEEMDSDALWRLALVSVWAGRPEVAVATLQTWPAEAARPAAFDVLLARLRRGESVPFDTRSARLSLD